jgi:uncharacterized protein YfdQ (DUF2303 family)
MPSPNEPYNVKISAEPEASAVARVVKDHFAAQVVSLTRGGPSGAAVLVLPKEAQVIGLKPLLDAYLPTPERRTGTAHLVTLESFIAHVLRNKDSGSVIFADPNPKAPSMTAIFDYNLAGPAAMEGSEEGNPARHGHHRAAYAFPLSEEWKAWTAQNDQPMTQAGFAAFLENRIADVSEFIPDKVGETARAFFQKVGLGVAVAGPNRLLQLSRDFAVHADEKVRSAINLQTGETTIQYEAAHVDQQGAPLQVPGAFLIGMPVFKGGAPYEVAARLRYRKDGPTIKWSYQLYRTDLIFDHAFAEAFNEAATKTGLPLFQGTPEA